MLLTMHDCQCAAVGATACTPAADPAFAYLNDVYFINHNNQIVIRHVPHMATKSPSSPKLPQLPQHRAARVRPLSAASGSVSSRSNHSSEALTSAAAAVNPSDKLNGRPCTAALSRMSPQSKPPSPQRAALPPSRHITQSLIQSVSRTAQLSFNSTTYNTKHVIRSAIPS